MNNTVVFNDQEPGKGVEGRREGEGGKIWLG